MSLKWVEEGGLVSSWDDVRGEASVRELLRLLICEIYALAIASVKEKNYIWLSNL